MQRKLFAHAALAVAMACVTLVAQQSPATAATVKPLTTLGPVQIVGLQSQKCLNDPNNSQQNNVQIIIYHCSPVTANGEWFFEDKAGGKWIWNDLSLKCLTVQNASLVRNTPIIQYTCNLGANELWTTSLVENNNGHAYYAIVSVNNPNMCLTVQNQGTFDGAKLLQYDCNGGDNQLWTW